MVFVKLKPYRQRSLARKINEKLGARFYGPYEVLARIGEVAYRLNLPENSKVHPTFHVSQLKMVIGAVDRVEHIPSHISVDGVMETEPEAFLGTRTHPVSGQEEVLIQWKGLPVHDSSWEWRSTIQGQYPQFDLEDKVNFKGGGIDTLKALQPPILYQYSRKKKAQQAGESSKVEQNDVESSF